MKVYNLADFRDEMIRRGVTKRPGKATTLSIARYGESELDRVVRRVAEQRKAFYGAIVQSARARLALLALLGRHAPSLKVKCPWARLTPCTDECHCLGTGKVSVGFLVLHYERAVAEYQRFA